MITDALDTHAKSIGMEVTYPFLPFIQLMYNIAYAKQDINSSPKNVKPSTRGH